MSYPGNVKCIAHQLPAKKGKSWCGQDLAPWSFIDIDHAALNGERGGYLVTCVRCFERVVAALSNGGESEK